jgi:hypothetical protein
VSVLDPFEYVRDRVWPQPHLQSTTAANADAKALLMRWSGRGYEEAIAGSHFGVVLNGRTRRVATVDISLGTIPSLRGRHRQ